ncbi:MAG: 3'-5' exonuclease [Ignavibacteria bacterium RBG_13_36_8]|nr:MAG: 3'-5' exonuclease [Ignavibacteria bacterium RBG_13_36_8]
MKLVIDIETVGVDLESLSESQQEYLLRYAEREADEETRSEKRDEVIRCLSLYPYTAAVVAIGMLNVETERSIVFYNSEADLDWVADEKLVKYKAMNEENMLRSFWDYMKKCRQVITFNGRNFDLPFLVLRSAMYKIKPSKNLIKNRYDISEHLDLLEQLTFFGLTKKFNLDFYCHAFGIESPKSKGITGMEVKELFHAGKIKEIAVYCADDIRATYELYKIWNEYLAG